MNENLTFKEKMELKWLNFKNWAETKVHNGVTWVADHPVEAAAIAGSLAAGAKQGYKLAKIHEERVHRDCDFYDPRTGKYTRTKRRPKSWEMDEIEYRYGRGESYNSILRDLNLRK